jgi:hypothetical protein
MKNSRFAATVGALVLASLEAVALRYNLQRPLAITPFCSCTMTMPYFPVTITPIARGIGRSRSDPTAPPCR